MFAILAQLQTLAQIAPELVEYETTALVRSLTARAYTCAHCGKPYIAKTAAKRERGFCGTRCRKAAQRRRARLDDKIIHGDPAAPKPRGVLVARR
jgi:hypothetical protein